ncbi:MAG: hypothetical protein ACHQ6U_12745 [Thermodesulfobacteriota bacterium]
MIHFIKQPVIHVEHTILKLKRWFREPKQFHEYDHYKKIENAVINFENERISLGIKLDKVIVGSVILTGVIPLQRLPMGYYECCIDNIEDPQHTIPTVRTEMTVVGSGGF